jgi:hypothetical protein
MKLARARADLRTIVVLANDTGQRYFSTALCGEEKELDIPERDHVLDQRSVQLLDQHQSGWEVLE